MANLLQGGYTVLVTGGATGIGYALAASLIQAKNTVIISGRREDKLKDAVSKLGMLILPHSTFSCKIILFII